MVEDAAARLRRIERDLHDGAQAQLVAVAMKLGLATEKLSGGCSRSCATWSPDQRTREVALAKGLGLALMC